MLDSAFVHALLPALVIGAFGGAGLVLTHTYSRRGPLIFPVYAAILFALTLSLSRAAGLGFRLRFAAALAGIVVSTAIAMVDTMIKAERRRRELVAAGREFGPGQTPVWAAPLLLMLLSTASAAAAYVSM